jgi:hypothetical protein
MGGGPSPSSSSPNALTHAFALQVQCSGFLAPVRLPATLALRTWVRHIHHCFPFRSCLRVIFLRLIAVLCFATRACWVFGPHCRVCELVRFAPTRLHACQGYDDGTGVVHFDVVQYRNGDGGGGGGGGGSGGGARAGDAAAQKTPNRARTWTTMLGPSLVVLAGGARVARDAGVVASRSAPPESVAAWKCDEARPPRRASL